MTQSPKSSFSKNQHPHPINTAVDRGEAEGSYYIIRNRPGIIVIVKRYEYEKYRFKRWK
jgi:hypothetical protein